MKYWWEHPGPAKRRRGRREGRGPWDWSDSELSGWCMRFPQGLRKKLVLVFSSSELLRRCPAPSAPNYY